jgi:hypothetical protein
MLAGFVPMRGLGRRQRRHLLDRDVAMVFRAARYTRT